MKVITILITTLMLVFASAGVIYADGPPEISVVKTGTPKDGYFFLTTVAQDFNLPSHILIYDNDGNVVYHKENPCVAADLKKTPMGGLVYFDYCDDAHVLLDQSYQEIRRYKALDGYITDLHDIDFTPEGNPLIMIYDIKQNEPWDMVLQELSVDGTQVLFTWKANDHFLPTDAIFPHDENGDYHHTNSAKYTPDGNIVISNRHMNEITKISRTDGSIIWRLGGQNNQFFMQAGIASATGAFPCAQHDAYLLPDGRLTLFDNAALCRDTSRAVEYILDEENLVMTQTFQYEGPYAFATGSYDPHTRVIGWGTAANFGNNPIFTELDEAGNPLIEGFWKDEKNFTYRVFKFEWEGIPADPPELAFNESGALMASWNGSTETQSYNLYTDEGTMVTNIAKSGFMTEIPTTGLGCIAWVSPVDGNNQVGPQSNRVAIPGACPAQSLLPMITSDPSLADPQRFEPAPAPVGGF